MKGDRHTTAGAGVIPEKPSFVVPLLKYKKLKLCILKIQSVLLTGKESLMLRIGSGIACLDYIFHCIFVKATRSCAMLTM